MVPQLFIEPHRWQDSGTTILVDEMHYLRNVLRLKIGDQLIVSDGTGRRYMATLRALEKKSAVIERGDELPELVESPIRITLIQCIPRTKKMDIIVQKVTELGVHSLCPVVSARSFQPADPKTGAKWVQRWQKIVEEAARQSGRSVLPRVSPIVSLEKYLDNNEFEETNLVLWEDSRAESIGKVMSSDNRTRCIRMVVGPEGGLTEDEIESARSNDWHIVSLGRRILRTETAAIVGMSIIQFCWGDLK